MKAITIAEEWASYHAALLVPLNAPAVQVEETKCAFFAGAQSMYAAMLAAIEPEDEAVCDQRLEALGREMADFIRLFKARFRLSDTPEARA